MQEEYILYTIYFESMFIMKKSFVLTSALPSATNNPDLFMKAVEKLSSFNVSTVEFFCNFDLSCHYRYILEQYSMKGIFLAAAYQKKNGLSLCSVDESTRETAVSATYRCFDAGKNAGADCVLITSGYYPGEKFEEKSWNKLKKSIRELSDAYPGMEITLEPGDRDIDAMQLVGPTQQTVLWAKDIKKDIQKFWLTMDTSHIAQLNENIYHSLEIANGLYHHIHLANCILEKTHPLFGDKHPMFGDPDAFYKLEEFKEIVKKIDEKSTDKFLVSIEIINRNKNEWEGFLSILDEEAWFLNQ